jgi:hypothetical protein
LRILGGQDAVDTAVRFYNSKADQPVDFVNQEVRCRDKTSGRILDCIVVDYMSSAATGEGYFVLEDKNGQRRQVPPREFDEIRVD